MNEKINIKDLKKIYKTNSGKEFLALADVDLKVNEGEFVSIVGPSGCGKSTLLRIIAGLDTKTEGILEIDGKEIVGPGADRGMVFQAYSLFPWLTVEENIRFGLDLKGMNKSEADDIVEKYLKLIKLTDFRKNYPKELSGGMRQRVAIARSLANSPEVLLMDEPFGALDPQTKMSMQELLLDIWRSEKNTIIFITHDIDESIFLSQKVCVMSTHPGTIISEIPVDLPINRTRKVKDSDVFIRTKNTITSLLNGTFEFYELEDLIDEL